jgi:hypothetical protein
LIVGDHLGCISPSLAQGTGSSFIKRRTKPPNSADVQYRPAAGPGLIIDYLIFDHFDSFIIGGAARQVGGSQSIHLLLGVDNLTPYGVRAQISRRLVVEKRSRLSKSQAVQVADRVKDGPSRLIVIVLIVGRNLGTWVHLVIFNCGLQDDKNEGWRP